MCLHQVILFLLLYRVAVMMFQSAYGEAYDLTQKMLVQHSDNLLVCLKNELNRSEYATANNKLHN